MTRPGIEPQSPGSMANTTHSVNINTKIGNVVGISTFIDLESDFNRNEGFHGVVIDRLNSCIFERKLKLHYIINEFKLLTHFHTNNFGKG